MTARPRGDQEDAVRSEQLPLRSTEEESFSEINSSEEGSRTPRRCFPNWKNVLLIGGFFIVGFLIGVGVYSKIQNQEKPAPPESAGPKQGSLQMISQEDTNDSYIAAENQENDLEYLEKHGMLFYLKASISKCPFDICRNCTTKVYEAPTQNLPRDEIENDPVKCNDTRRTYNATCWLYEYRGSTECWTFNETLNKYSTPNQSSEPTCGEILKLANLNHFCHNGRAVLEKPDHMNGRSLASRLKCNCSLGYTGEHCEKEAEREKVLCKCYNKRYKLQEKQPEFHIDTCENIPYSKTSKCLHTTNQENCFCVAEEDRELLNNTASCDTEDPEMGRQGHNEAEIISATLSLHLPLCFLVNAAQLVLR